jgi:4-hydroxy-tetrahydrodipicolinate synthase
MHVGLKGILPAMVTPLTADGKVMEKELRNFVEFLVRGSVHGIFAVGTTGEIYGITDEEYRKVLEISLGQTAGLLPVYAGANAISTHHVIRLAKIAAAVGMNAVSVLTPFFLSVNQRELFGHFKAIAEATPLPIILYDNKPKTQIFIYPETVANLADIPNIVGMKDSTGDFTNMEECLRLTKGKDFAMMQGRDTLIHAGLCYGAKGAVAACAMSYASISTTNSSPAASSVPWKINIGWLPCASPLPSGRSPP